jgi:hypothetical protein
MLLTVNNLKGAFERLRTVYCHTMLTSAVVFVQ